MWCNGEMRTRLSDQAGSYPGEGRADLGREGLGSNHKPEFKKKKVFKGCAAPARPAEATGTGGFTLPNS